MDQTVRPTNVHEGAKLPQAGYDTCPHFSQLELVDHPGLLILTPLPDRLPFRQHQPPAARVHFDHLERNHLVHHFGHVIRLTLVVQAARQVGDVRSGHETAQATEWNNQAAAVVTTHDGLQDSITLQQALGTQPIAAFAGLRDRD